MAITSIKTGSSFTNLVKYDSFLAGNTAFSPSSYESIATATGTGSSGTITFSSIPSTYKHLQIRSNFIGTSAGGSLLVRCNGDTGANYAYHFIEGLGSSITVSGGASSANAYFGFYSNGVSATYPSTSIVDVIDYASTTKTKTLRAFNGCDINGAVNTGQVSLNSVMWNNTAAITSISLLINVASYTTSSTFALYGIKG